MEKLNQRILDLENQVQNLTTKLNDLMTNTEDKGTSPYSKVGAGRDRSLIRPADMRAGFGQLYGSGICFNDTELGVVAFGVEPETPKIGYNKHTHSRFSGGALLLDGLEIVEYDLAGISNIHSQQYWGIEPDIKKVLNSNNKAVEKIGLLDLIFNPDTVKWGVAALEIDIKKCMLVERDVNGDIVLDETGTPKQSPLYNVDTTKSSIVWDKNAKCFRLYAVYAPEPVSGV